MNIGIYTKMMNIENNDFLLGVIKKNKKKQNNSKKNNSNMNNVFIQELIKIQNTIRQETNNGTTVPPMSSNYNKLSMMVNKESGKNENTGTKSFKNILLGIIRKLEDDVEKVSRQIQRYNDEKKSILEMDKKEILKLKTLTKKLYQTIMKIYMSLDVNKNVRIELLEKLKKNIESNKILLKNIDEINQIKPVENILNEQKIASNIDQNKNENKNKNKNLNKNKNKNQEEEEQNENQSNNVEEPSNVTIFNIIQEEQTQKNKNKNKNNNKVSNQVVEEVIETEESENESESSNDIQSVSLNQQIKEKKINTSKKVSKKLNELTMNNSQAGSLLNNFIMERTGSTQVQSEMSTQQNQQPRQNNMNRIRNRNNSLQQNQQQFNRRNNYQSTPVTTNSRRNNNVFI